MKKVLLLPSFLCFFSAFCNCQIFQFTFENSGVVTTDNAVGTPTFGVSGVGNDTYQEGASTNCSSPDGFARSYTGWHTDDYYLFTVNTTGYSSMQFGCCLRTSNVEIGTFSIRVGTALAAMTTIVEPFTPTTAFQSFSATLPSNLDDESTVYIQIYKTDNAGNSGYDLRIDNATLTGSLLPVELTSFQALKKNSTSQLIWQTASELNNSHFSIERSSYGLNFREIGIVQGNGTTTEPQHYEFMDEYPANGTNYYRLKQMDFDEGFEYSKVVSVNFGTSSHALLYPTLASTTLNLKFTKPIAENGNITLYDINGKLVDSHDIETETEQMEISVENLLAGYYFAKVQIGRLFENLRFVKQ